MPSNLRGQRPQLISSVGFPSPGHPEFGLHCFSGPYSPLAKQHTGYDSSALSHLSPIVKVCELAPGLFIRLLSGNLDISPPL
jgi:hypothetical protein